MRYFSPRFCAMTWALLASSLDDSRLYSDVILLDHLSVLGQAQDAQPGHLGRGKDGGMGALDIAARAHADDEVAIPDAGYRDLQLARHPVMVRCVLTAARRQQADRPEHHLHSLRVAFAETSLRSYFCHIVFPSDCNSAAAAPPGYIGRWSATTSPFCTPE